MQFGKYVTCDISKCSGCRACEMACFKEHNAGNGVGVSVGTVSVPVNPRLFVTKLSCEVSAPIQCKHCEDAPCLNACSKEAISRIDGQVIIDTDKCIGCKDCMLACPFGAIELYKVYKNGEEVRQNGSDDCRIAAHKCDLCIDNPNGPACVRACPNEALFIVDPQDDKKKKNLAALETMLKTAGSEA